MAPKYCWWLLANRMGKKDKVLAVPTHLRAWRKARHLTQEQLAVRADLTAPTISQIEVGRQGFTDESLAALAQALGCTPAALIAHDPRRHDSFWPLFEAAERLEGRERRQLLAILASVLNPGAGESE